MAEWLNADSMKITLELDGIKRLLAELPAQLAEARSEAAQKMLAYKQAKHDAEVLRASTILRIGNEHEKITVSRLEAMVTVDQRVVKEDAAVIVAEGEWRSAAIKVDNFSSKFEAVKYQAKLLEGEVKSL